MKKALGFNRKFSRVTVSFLWLGRWLIWNQLIFCKITYNCHEFEVNYITLLKKVRKMTFAFPSFEQINTVIIKYITKKVRWDPSLNVLNLTLGEYQKKYWIFCVLSYVQCHVFHVQYIYNWITMGSRSPEAIILYTWVERYRMECRVVYKSRQLVKFARFSAKFCRLLSLLHESK